MMTSDLDKHMYKPVFKYYLVGSQVTTSVSAQKSPKAKVNVKILKWDSTIITVRIVLL